MKREIKFRAWDSRDGKWVFINEDIWAMVPDMEEAWGIKHYIELTQYTGLKDKNGKEIYEGDILTRKIAETWVDTGEQKCIVEDLRFLSHIMDTNIPFEVIGNIYENPELMSQ